MNKLYTRLFVGVRITGIYMDQNPGLSLYWSNVKVISTTTNNPFICYYPKPWTYLNSNTHLHSSVSCGEADFRPNSSYKLWPRFSCSDPLDDLDGDETFISADYNAFKMSKDHGIQGSITKLQEIMKCSKKKMSIILNEFPELLLVPSEMLADRLKNFKMIGLKREILKDYPWLLIYKPQEVARKFQIVSKMELDINVAAPLLQLPTYKLKELSYLATKEASLIPERNRIIHIGNALECNPTEVCNAAAQHVFLLTVPFQRISAILDLLLEYNVPGKDVLKDVWIFRYSPLTVEKRLKEMRNVGIQLKPWAIRCSEEVFSNALRRRVESRNTLGENSSILDYLSHRLDCSLENVILLGQRYPPILKVHVTKIKEVLDFLFSDGFTPYQVYQVPRILCHSLKTTQQRLQQLRDLQHNPSSLMVLCKSKRQFADYLSKLGGQQKQLFSC